MNATKKKKNDIVGKTIASVQQMQLQEFADKGFLKLTFTDGTDCVIVASYDQYTTEAQDEYPTDIEIKSSKGLCLKPYVKENKVGF